MVLQTNKLDPEITPVLGMRAKDPKMFLLAVDRRKEASKGDRKEKRKAGKPKGRKGWQGVAYTDKRMKAEWVES